MGINAHSTGRNSILFSAVLLALGGPAAADAEPALELTAIPTSGAPRVEATIAGGPRVPLEHIALIDDRGTRIAATALTPWREMNEPVTFAFLVASGEVMMGNTSIEPPESAARIPGYLPELRSAFAGLALAKLTPPGSQGLLVTYDGGIHAPVPLGPIANLTAEALGTEKTYYGRFGSELVAGLDFVFGELGHARTPRKVLVVIGDANDTNNETAAPRLAALAKRAAAEGIEMYALIYKGALSSSDDVLSKLVPHAQAVSAADGLPAALAAIVAQVGNRYRVAFPGDELRWDGPPLYVSVDLNGTRLGPVLLRAEIEPRRANPFFAWWFQLAMGLGAVGAIALVMRWRATKSLGA